MQASMLYLVRFKLTISRAERAKKIGLLDISLSLLNNFPDLLTEFKL